ncbi:50S ribosomal subunit protein L13 [Candidatus Nasuia deltocephalinicola]|uniref:50S ribosomal subunit protein L13 n=1 Tax=Candidatus Nasuia deltocephalincola TaxID=1160784 RepID=A0A7G6UHV2_9PROT|nr:50S ribosomal subunit protein L13 [Candidatus Nasuia deltocephalinicola]
MFKSKWYIINIKNKDLKKLIDIINKININKRFFNNNRNNKIIIFNENFLKIDKKNFKINFFYRYSGYIGGLKKINFLKFYQKNPKEFLKNYIIRSVKNKKLKKYLKNKIKFFKNNYLIKKIKNKILNF